MPQMLYSRWKRESEQGITHHRDIAETGSATKAAIRKCGATKPGARSDPRDAAYQAGLAGPVIQRKPRRAWVRGLPEKSLTSEQSR